MNLNYRISSFRAVMKPIYFIISFIVGSALGILGFMLVVKNNLIDTSYRAYVVTSGSMEPAIKTGSIIITKAKPYYKIGDIVTFKNAGNTVTHRIVDINLETITTQGDANDSPDLSTTPRENIIGGRFLVVPYVGWVIDFAKTPRGFVAMIVIPASIIIYEELKSLVSETKKLLGRMSLRPKSRLSPMGAFLILMGVALLGGAGVKLIGVTQSSYLDREDFLNNSFQAANEFDLNPSPTPTPLPDPQSLVINEFLADPDQEFEDEWVEIYNPNSFDVDINGWRLEDNASHPKNLSGVVPANGFFVYDSNTSWLNNDGDSVLLINSENETVDQKDFESSQNDITYGRDPDGGSWFTCVSPTKNASNNGVCQP